MKIVSKLDSKEIIIDVTYKRYDQEVIILFEIDGVDVVIKEKTKYLNFCLKNDSFESIPTFDTIQDIADNLDSFVESMDV